MQLKKCRGKNIKPIDKPYYIKRNEETARVLYGDLLDENRRVEGTDIWFDWDWRIHIGNDFDEKKYL